jgi:hypothetical protein
VFFSVKIYFVVLVEGLMTPGLPPPAKYVVFANNIYFEEFKQRGVHTD